MFLDQNVGTTTFSVRNQYQWYPKDNIARKLIRLIQVRLFSHMVLDQSIPCRPHRRDGKGTCIVFSLSEPPSFSISVGNVAFKILAWAEIDTGNGHYSQFIKTIFQFICLRFIIFNPQAQFFSLDLCIGPSGKYFVICHGPISQQFLLVVYAPQLLGHLFKLIALYCVYIGFQYKVSEASPRPVFKAGT